MVTWGGPREAQSLVPTVSARCAPCELVDDLLSLFISVLVCEVEVKQRLWGLMSCRVRLGSGPVQGCGVVMITLTCAQAACPGHWGHP